MQQRKDAPLLRTPAKRKFKSLAKQCAAGEARSLLAVTASAYLEFRSAPQYKIHPYLRLHRLIFKPEEEIRLLSIFHEKLLLLQCKAGNAFGMMTCDIVYCIYCSSLCVGVGCGQPGRKVGWNRMIGSDPVDPLPGWTSRRNLCDSKHANRI